MLDALDALLAREVVFEINTGAIARGRRDVPYPMVYILRRIAERGGRVMINSDTHKKEHLMCAYERAAQLARSCGIGGFVVPTAHGWVTKPLGCR